MEEEEEEVLAGVSAEDKGRRPPGKSPGEAGEALACLRGPGNPTALPCWTSRLGVTRPPFPLSSPDPPEATPPGKQVDSKMRVPVHYCTLGSRDSAR